MRRSPKLRPNLWDGMVVLAVVVLAVVCAAGIWRGSGNQESLTAVISVDGTEVERISLAQTGETRRTVHGGGYTLEICLTDTEVWVEQSDCPTQDCVHTGHISRSGQSIVCLPARVVIELEGGPATDNGLDTVIG